MKRALLKPSPNGRDPVTGKFVKGNPGGPGNPHAGDTAKLRSALIGAITEKDIRAIVKKLITKAKAGDIRAARLVLDRVFGKPAQAVYLEVDDDLFDPDERFL